MASAPVSSKILLEAMLEKVGLPAATYSACPTEAGRLQVTVTFYPIKIRLRGSPARVSISTSEHQDLEEAQDYVAAAAIKYMDAYEGVIPKDYHYDQLKATEKANVLLGKQLKAMKGDNASLKQKLKECTEKNKILSKGWHGSLTMEHNIVSDLNHLDRDESLSTQSVGNPPLDPELRTSFDDGETSSDNFHALPKNRF